MVRRIAARGKLCLVHLLLFVIVVLGACQPQERADRDCDALFISQLQSLDFSVDGPIELREWLDAELEIAPGMVNTEGVDDPFGQSELTSLTRWIGNSRRYLGKFVGSDLVQVQELWTDDEPTGDDVLRCLGEPAFYMAYYDQPSTQFELLVDLWYPQKGLLVRAIEFGRDPTRPPTVSGQLRFDLIRYVAPNQSMEDVVADAFIDVWAEAREAWMAQIRPWPGTWEAVEVTIHPALLN